MALQHAVAPPPMPAPSESKLGLITDELDADSLRSAPPTVYEDPFRTRADPFANSPSTTTLASFPSFTTSGSSTASTVGTAEPADRQSHQHHHRLFGRSTSGRDYPRGNTVDDEEESESLVRNSSRDLEAGTLDIPPQGSIRLVPPVPSKP